VDVQIRDLAAQFAISRSGALVYITGSGSPPERSLVWVDRQGRVEPVTDERQAFASLRLSPDGRQLAVDVETSTNSDIWLYDLTRGTRNRLTFEKDNFRPVWTPDGRHLIFSSNREGLMNLFRKSVNGSGDAERLMPSVFGWQFPTGVSPDGRFVAFAQEEPETGWDLWVVPLEGDGAREPQPFVRTRFFEAQAAFSPDGRWLAYISNESGRYEVHVRPFPGPGRRWQVSTNGGREPLWSRDGRDLFYREAGAMAVGKLRKMMVVPVRTQPTFEAGSPRVLFEGRYMEGRLGPPEYDVTPDGQRFVMVQLPEEEEPVHRELVYVPDFFDELKAKVRAARR
jgi:serine/threonine-protein kinase